MEMETGETQLLARIGKLESLVAQQQTRIRELESLVVQQQEHIGELEGQLARAHKNSSNSSKPPSSDIVKPPKKPPQEGGGPRKKGAQPGHPKHERALFSPDQIDEAHRYTSPARRSLLY